MSQDNHQSLNHLINYYQTLNDLNAKFTDINTNNKKTDYRQLIEQLIVIRQSLIDKQTSNINAIYKPTERLFANSEHFIILGDTVQFFKQNGDVVYPMLEAEIDENVDNNEVSKFNATESPQPAEIIKNHSHTDTDSLSNPSCNDIYTQLSDIKELINKMMSSDFNQAIIKTNNDTLTVIKTNHELMKSDISRYDALLTEHINQSNMNIAEAIEKEHARFVHKMSSDINAIVDGITNANNAELKANLQKFEDKSLKWFFFAFLMSGIMMFGCSILSASWTAKKALDDAKVFKVSIDCAATTPSKKIKSLTIIK